MGYSSMRKLICASMFTVLLTFSWALPAYAQEENETERNPSLEATTAGIGDMGFKLFKALKDTESKKGPVAVSPLSISEATLLATNGAEGKTLGQLEGLFGESEEVTIANLNKGIKELRAALKTFAEGSSGTFDFSSANALYGNNNPAVNFKFRASYLEQTDKYFDASLKEIDFRSGTAESEINDWVKENTEGKIEKLIDKLEADDIAVLLNAIYAKGQFASHFPSLTEGKYRSNADAEEQTVTYMTQKNRMDYYQDEDSGLQVISLDIGKRFSNPKPQIALDILLPKDHDVAALSQSLNGEKYRDLISKLEMTKNDIELTIPVGKVAQKEPYKLKSVLTSDAFNLDLPFHSRKAEFDPIGTVIGENIYINDILTKAFYEVTPFGFEAAAATAVIVARATSAGPEPTEIKIDGSSLHVIRHKPTGTPLFIVEYDSPQHYDEKKILELIEAGYNEGKSLRAETEAGHYGVQWKEVAERHYQEVLALSDEEGKILKEFKVLKDLK